MTAAKAGDRVRVTQVIEGIVEQVETSADHGDRLLIRKDFDGPQRMAYGWINYGMPEQTVEVLAPPKPKWWPPRQGDVIQCSGSTYLVHGDGWGGPATVASAATGAKGARSLDEWSKWALAWHAEHPRLTFTLLVRHGKRHGIAP